MYSLRDVARLVPDIPQDYLEFAASIEQGHLYENAGPNQPVAWKNSKSYTGLFQLGVPQALDSGAVAFSPEEASQIRSYVRSGKAMPASYVERVRQADSAAVQAKALAHMWRIVRHKVADKRDFYFYHNQGAYAKKGRAVAGRQSLAARKALYGV